jgi:hypothetical protein
VLEAKITALQAALKVSQDKVDFYKHETAALRAAEGGCNKSLLREIEFLKSELKKAEGKLYSGLELDSFTAWYSKGSDELKTYIEALAAAYVKITDVPPGKAVLCTTIEDEGKKLVYWFETREKMPEAVQKFDYL